MLPLCNLLTPSFGRTMRILKQKYKKGLAFGKVTCACAWPISLELTGSANNKTLNPRRVDLLNHAHPHAGDTLATNRQSTSGGYAPERSSGMSGKK